jgi:TolA-binding protein
MMKVVLLSLFLFAAAGLSGYAQRNIEHEFPNKLFVRGKEMFLDKNYVGAQDILSKYKSAAKDKSLISEADYMIAVSEYFRGKESAIGLLRDYLDDYPETYHRDDTYYYMGSYYFGKQDWNRALFWFNQTDVAYVNETDQEVYAFRTAYANLQVGKLKEAAHLFDLLIKNSREYYISATYYRAYIDFREGNYDKSLSTFNRLKNNPEYKEQAHFYITQGLFLKGDLQNAVRAAEDYLNKYPKNKNSNEIYRILGNSYYRLNDTRQAIAYYERYVSNEGKPFREDMFQLGEAYTQTGDYAKAIGVLQSVASKEDALGQAAYMLLGQNYLRTGDNSNALMAFDAASRVYFDKAISEAALYNYAMLAHQTSLSVFGQSVTVLRRFLTEYPQSAYANEVNKQLAASLLSTDNYQAALNVINDMRSPDKQILEAKQTILFQLGAQSFINGDYNRSKQLFDQTISMGNLDTESKNEAYFWRGESYYRLNDYQPAIYDYQTYITQAGKQGENYTNALYNKGYAQFNLKQYANALNTFRQYTAQESNRQSRTYSDAMNRIGDCLLFNRDFTGAERAYTQASSTGGQGAEYADFQKAFVLGLQHDYAAKISAMDALMNKYPGSSYYDDALYEKSRALVMLNREQDAIRSLNVILNNYPESNIAPQAGILLGQSYYNTNDTQGAIRAYKNVIQKYRNTEEARSAIQSLEGIYRDMNDIQSYADYVNSLGEGVIFTASRQDSLTYLAAENVYMKGNSNDALKALNSYLQTFPNGQFAGDAHFYIGTIAYDRKDYDPALSEFNRAIQAGTTKNLTKAFSSIAAIQYGKGNLADAYKAYKDYERVAVSPEDKAEALLGVLKLSVDLDKRSEAIDAANRLLSNEKASPEVTNQALLYRAKAYLNGAENSKAIPDLQKASADARSTSGAEAQYLLAETYYKAGMYNQAEQQVKAFMKQNTPHAYWMARAIIVLSDTYLAKGDKFQAKQYLESLKENYTGNEADIASMIENRLKAIK